MEYLVLIIVIVAIVAYKYFQPSGSNQNSSSAPAKKDSDSPDTTDLRKEIDAILDAPEIDEHVWRKDEATDRQIAKLKQVGLTIKDGGLSKGKASELIGLFSEPDESELEILRFFKAPIRGITQTTARQHISQLFSDTNNKALWENRPATAEDKEQLLFYGIKKPKELNHKIATKLISDFESENEDAPIIEHWDQYLAVFDDLSDKDTLDDYDSKKISWAQYRKVVKALLDDGPTTYDGLDLDEVIEKAHELNPSLRKM